MKADALGVDALEIVQVKPRGYAHAEALTEFAEATYHGIRRLGLRVFFQEPPPEPVRQILIGAHLLGAESAMALPANAIIYNSEQIYPGSPWLKSGWYLELLARHEVWDYSADNLERLRQFGVARGRLARLGFVPELVRIAPAAEDIDVLFYGSTGARREAILEALKQRGLNVVSLFGAYGEERDRAIARAKIILNVHQHATKIFEIVRIAYPLSNYKAVVSECGPGTAIEPEMRAAICGVPYEQLVDACVALARDDETRRKLALRGHELFAARRAERELAAALDVPPSAASESQSAPPRRLIFDALPAAGQNALIIGLDEACGPDVAIDLAAHDLVGKSLATARFGRIELRAESLESIETNAMLTKVADLDRAMTNCLRLLRPGGLLRISVPYRSGAFDQLSWRRFTDEHWRVGWVDMRFDALSIQALPSALGLERLAAGASTAEVLAIPGTMERLEVVLRKRYTQQSERRSALSLMGGRTPAADAATSAEGGARADAAGAAFQSADELTRLCNLAALLGKLGRHAEAVQAAAAALELDSHCAPALFNQAASLQALGDPIAARDRLERLVVLTPHDAKVYNNLALAQEAAGDAAAALESYDRALALLPNYARAWNNRGTIFMKLGRFEAALADLERAVALDPQYTRALLNRGSVLRSLGRYETALESYRRAFPNPEALENALDLAMRELRRATEALNFATKLYWQVPDRDDVAGAYHAVCQGLASWADYTERSARIIDGVRAGRRPATPFRFLYVSDDPDDQLRCARAAGSLLQRRAPSEVRRPVHPHTRIRVGYLSSDFQTHATAYLMAGLFERHDRRRFECFAYAYGRCGENDPMRARLETAFEHFADVDGLSASATAERIRADEIDVLVDLKGYTSGSRLETLSYRPAPIQAHYLGYPGTLGTEFVDYLIADPHVIPPGEAGRYAEQIARLPHTYQATDDRREVPSQDWTRERAGLPADAIVLAAFHQTYKLNPPVFAVWMRLLRNLPTACLWLLVREPAAQANICQEARARGIDPKRIVFASEVAQSDHLARHRLADLLLDTWPYSAHTTASDALWMGLPLVALTGRSFAARVSGSILRAAGLAELITNSLEGYEALIMELCSDVSRLAGLRSRIESTVRRSPLFDTASFTRALEDCYEQMWRRHRQGLPPAPIQAAWPEASQQVTGS